MSTAHHPEIDVALALAQNDYLRATEMLMVAVDAAEGLSERGAMLVRLADAERKAGRSTAAWAVAREAAAIGRVLRDGALIADAVLATPIAGAGSWTDAAEQHELGREAIGLLDHDDTDREHRLQALIASTVDVWSGAQPQPIIGGSLTPEGRFAELRARHQSLLHIRYAEERLTLAIEAEHGGAPDEHRAWALLWRAGASAQLGRRNDLNAAIMRLGHVVRRLREPVWNWRLTTAHASIALLDGEVTRAKSLAGAAIVAAGESAAQEVPYVDLILRSRIAMRTGEGLDAIDEQLADVLRGAPFAAQGWRALVLCAAKKRDDAIAIWRALAPGVDELPGGPIEWLIAVTTFAQLAVIAGDRDAATSIYRVLLPVDGRWIAADACTPSSGPVSLQLGHLAVLLGDRAAARQHLRSAIIESERMHDRLAVAEATSALAGLGDDPPGLSRREREIADLVAEGRTNRAIATSLFLSERTVESHVAHILAKLDLRSRAGIAAWATRTATSPATADRSLR